MFKFHQTPTPTNSKTPSQLLNR